MSKTSYEGINDYINEVTATLKTTKKLYNERWDKIFDIETDIDVISNQIRRAVNSSCKAYGSMCKIATFYFILNSLNYSKTKKWNWQ